MKFLVDAQLPPSLARWLTERGHEARHVGEVGLLAASDREIEAHVERWGITLVSKDEKFLFLRLPARFTLLWLRCGNASNRALIEWLGPRWGQIEEHLAKGEQIVEVR